MKLLLDEMWLATIAVQLRQRGHDVLAVSERPELRGQADEVIYATAQSEGRVIVTENVVDYRPLAAASASRGESHAGLIFTSNRRFPRHHRRTPGRLVTALDQLIETGRSCAGSEHWLQ